MFDGTCVGVFDGALEGRPVGAIVGVCDGHSSTRFDSPAKNSF